MFIHSTYAEELPLNHPLRSLLCFDCKAKYCSSAATAGVLFYQQIVKMFIHTTYVRKLPSNNLLAKAFVFRLQRQSAALSKVIEMVMDPIMQTSSLLSILCKVFCVSNAEAKCCHEKMFEMVMNTNYANELPSGHLKQRLLCFPLSLSLPLFPSLLPLLI